jgi:2-polyprenyl-3-methyl-5-hydroxy-6-metoxy-1,4-benzoquinol methylase
MTGGTKTETSERPLPFEPAPGFFAGPLQKDEELAQCQGKRIGILIVAYNALTTLTKVLKRITPAVWENVEEVAVFDDASQDATYELAAGLKTTRNLPKLHVLHHSSNLGYGGNQKAGYQYFIEKGFDIAVLLHGDGQYAPEILSHMYAPIVRGEADAVFGSRMMRDYGGPLKGGMPLYKYVGNRVLTTIENHALGLNLTEFHSGYRAYDLHALQKINLENMTNDFHFDTEIIIKLHHQKYKIHEVPVPTFYGDEVCYVNGMKYAKDIVRSVYHYRQTCRSVRRYPEFQEYFVQYPIKRSKGSSHDLAQRLTGTGQSVLDVGSGPGHLSQELRKAGNRVDGIDLMAEVRRPSPYEQYVCADLDQGIQPALEQLGSKKYDRVLLLDVLEHLVRPAEILKQCAPVLEENGFVIVSVPNIANITVRLSLLLGRFQYTDRGILDRTHLHFYTRSTATALLRDAGYQILEKRMTAMPIELVFGLDPGNPLMRLVNLFARIGARLWPGLLGYQIVLTARPARTGA